MKKPDFKTVMIALITLLYPFVIWISQGVIAPRFLAILLIAIVSLRLMTVDIAKKKYTKWGLSGALLLATFAILQNSTLPLKMYPVLVSLSLLALFGYSLRGRQTIIERLARIKEPQLPDYAIAYTRRVTQVWCVFFACNALIAAATAIWASDAIWSLYTGLISYVLMGTLFAGEFLVRLYIKRQYHQVHK